MTTPAQLDQLSSCYCFNDAQFQRIVAYLLDQINSGGSGSVQDMQVAWTPSSFKLGQNLGFFTFGDIPGVTTITFNQTTDLSGFDIENTSTITSLSWPNLTSIDPSNTQGGYLDLENNSGLTSVSLPLLATVAGLFGINGSNALASISVPSLKSCFRFNCNANSALTSLSIPLFTTTSGAFLANSNNLLTSLNISSLTTVGGQFQVHLNPLLTSIPLNNFVPTNGQSVLIDGNALAAATVNLALHRCVLQPTWGNAAETFDSSGGTNAAPSGQGIADKATLQGRGATVNTN